MGVNRLKLPSITLDLPRPGSWDLAAAGALLMAVVVAAAAWAAAGARSPGSSLAPSVTLALGGLELLLALASLMLLGKTAKEGTIWGNLAAVGGMLAGIVGVFLIAVIWAAA